MCMFGKLKLKVGIMIADSCLVDKTANDAKRTWGRNMLPKTGMFYIKFKDKYSREISLRSEKGKSCAKLHKVDFKMESLILTTGCGVYHVVFHYSS